MKEIYIVTSTGIKSKNSYSSLSRIVQGTKDNGDRYAFIDSNNRIQEGEELPLGSIVHYETKRLPTQGTVKINETAK